MANETLDLTTTNELLKAMLVLSRTVERILEVRASEAAGELLSKSRLQTLFLLSLRGSQTSTQIAAFLGVSKPAVTQIVRPMLETGLTQRRPSTGDGRQFELSLTPKGRRTLGKVRRKQRHFIRNATRQLGTEEAGHWAETLVLMARKLVDADRVFQDFCLQCGAHDDGSCVLTGGGAKCLYLESSI